MKLELKTVFGDLIFEGDFPSMKELVLAAVTAKKSLSFANLSSADLCFADLSSADLRFADLSSADLRFADLSYANLSSADLRYADLRFANLCFADLSFANLCFANLSSANLSSADLSSADLRKLYATRTILPEGDLIGYKKLLGGTICKLRIPAAAKRVGGLVGRKCRAEFAVVLEGEGFSRHDPTFKYVVGETVRPKGAFNDSLVSECESGIHFFITRQEAEDYSG